MIAAQPVPPAGGAAVDEIFIALGIAMAAAIPVAWFVWRELAGKPTLLGKLADWLAEKDGLPRWVSLPTYALVPVLLMAGWGVWWDVPIHMQQGRDEGPLANPSHYPIYLAILAIFGLGVITATLAYRQPLPERALKVFGVWRVPMGAVLMIAAGTIALIGFPADDVWHRLFGQDVTEWGPTHVMMIGGAVTAPLALPLLRAEAAAAGYQRKGGRFGKLIDTVQISLCIVPFAFLMEFDLGVPQFPAATQFIIAAFLTGWVFVTARRFFGPGGALIAWGVYAFARAFLYLTIVPLPGVLESKFLLLLPAALLVEIVALLTPQRGYALGVVAGLGAGSAGMLAEWVWSGWFMPLPQQFPSSALPMLIGASTVAGLGGGLLGVWHHRQLEVISGEADPPPAERSFVRLHALGLTGLLLFVGLMWYFAPPAEDEDGIAARVQLSENCDGATFGCMSTVTVTFDPIDAADDAVWLYALAWQGQPGHPDPATAPGQGVLRVRMEPTGSPGQFRSAEPLPMYGSWKTAVRLHNAPTTMMLAQLYAPDDPAIESERGRQVLVESGDVVQLGYEPEWLQRERIDDLPEWLWTAGYAAVGLAWAALIAVYGWCYGRAAGTGRRPAQTPRQRQSEQVR